MTNASVNDVREALAARFASQIAGLRTYTHIPGEINPPSAFIIPGGSRGDGRVLSVIKYDSTMANGSHEYMFTAKLVVSTVVDRVSQELLDDYVSPDGAKSLRTAIDIDPTLGGLVSYARADSLGGYGALTYNGNQYVGADLIIEVIT